MITKCSMRSYTGGKTKMLYKGITGTTHKNGIWIVI